MLAVVDAAPELRVLSDQVLLLLQQREPRHLVVVGACHDLECCGVHLWALRLRNARAAAQLGKLRARIRGRGEQKRRLLRFALVVATRIAIVGHAQHEAVARANCIIRHQHHRPQRVASLQNFRRDEASPYTGQHCPAPRPNGPRTMHELVTRAADSWNPYLLNSKMRKKVCVQRPPKSACLDCGWP